jgi:hypothetical protein
MRIQDEHMTNTTITSPREQGASGASSKLVHHRPPSGRTQVGHFLRHYLEMCAAMCLGEAVLDVLFFGGAWLIWHANLISQFPELSTLVIAFNMSVPMIAWMRFRGMEWRPTLEMSGAMFVEAIVLIGVSWLGIITKSSLVFWQEALMMPIMLIPMLFRLDLYTGRVGHRAHAA